MVLDLIELADSIAADDSPIGNSEVTATTKTCPRVSLRLGLFFDGTYNNAHNVANGIDTKSAKTNIWELYGRYPGRSRRRGRCGSVVEEHAGYYVEGIGTALDRQNDGVGGATGHGDFGIDRKLREASIFLRERIGENGGIDNIERIEFDVFGFSRGAATARVFCNQIAEMGDPKLRVRFLGLFDTVGSFGVPGNSVQMQTDDEIGHLVCSSKLILVPGIGISCLTLPDAEVIDLNIRTSTADTVFHITAEDEFRVFFPLSSAKPGHAIEVSMPGCHGDVGGGYLREEMTEVYDSRAPQLVRSGWFDNATSRQGYANMRTGISKTYYDRRVKPGLSVAPLIAMWQRASDAGAPFGHSVWVVDPPVNDLAERLIAGRGADPHLARILRADYVHRSFGGGSNIAMPFYGRGHFDNRP